MKVGARSDLFRLQYAILGADDNPEENVAPLVVEPQYPQTSKFSLDLAWDLPTLEEDTFWYGAVEINMPNEAVSIPVRLSMESADPDADAEGTEKPTFRRRIQ